MKSYRAIALTFGTDEDRKINWMIWQCDKPLKSRKAALQSFCLYLFKIFKESVMESTVGSWLLMIPACCSDHYDSTKTFPLVCPDCKKEWDGPEFEYCEYDFLEFLLTMGEETLDSVDQKFIKHEDDKRINPYGWKFDTFTFDVQRHQMLVVTEMAELLIIRILCGMFPELETLNKVNYMLCDDVYHDVMLDDTFTDEDIQETKILDYPNGAQQILVNGVIESIVYNTGDEVTFEYKHGNYEVISVISADKKTQWHKYALDALEQNANG